MKNEMTNERHYTEADLLETYYTEPGASMPVMMHLARCSDCAARYERLARKLRGLSACDTERSESFWASQRASILGRIGAQSEGRFGRRVAGLAAAAAFVLAIGGVATWKQLAPAAAVESTPAISVIAQDAEAEDAQIAADPWQSEQLRDFQDVVEWESWVDPGTQKEGRSL